MDLTIKRINALLRDHLDPQESGYKDEQSLSLVIREALRGNRRLPPRLQLQIRRFFTDVICHMTDFQQLSNARKIEIARMFAVAIREAPKESNVQFSGERLCFEAVTMNVDQIITCQAHVLLQSKCGMQIIEDLFHRVNFEADGTENNTCKLFFAFNERREAEYFWISMSSSLSRNQTDKADQIERRLVELHVLGTINSIYTQETQALFPLITPYPISTPTCYFLIFDSEEDCIRYKGFGECRGALSQLCTLTEDRSQSSECGPSQVYRFI